MMSNTELVARYPFLAANVTWFGDIIESYDPEADGTYLDDMPEGWKIAFGEQMCEELRNELIKWDWLDKYHILQVKEKYGSLRWYTSGVPIGKYSDEYVDVLYDEYKNNWKEYQSKYPSEEYYRYPVAGTPEIMRFHKFIDKCKIYDIVDKYEVLSTHTCVECGKPATKMSTGWICPYCDEHAPEGSEPIENSEFAL